MDQAAPLVLCHHKEEDMVAVKRYAEISVNRPSSGILVSELLWFDDRIECTEKYSNKDIVQIIVVADGNNRSKDDGEAEDSRNLDTLGEQLRVIVRLKPTFVAHGMVDESFLRTLRGLHFWRPRSVCTHSTCIKGPKRTVLV